MRRSLFALVLLSPAGCITFTQKPGTGMSPVMTRGPIKDEIVQALVDRSASRDDAILELGEPDVRTPDRLEYRWVMSKETRSNGFFGVRLVGLQRQEWTLILRFDASGRLTSRESTQGPWIRIF